MQASDSKDRTVKSPSAVRRLWRAQHLWRIFLQGLCSPFFNAGALFGFISLPFFLFFVFLFVGSEGMLDESIILVASSLALLATLPAWALINLVIAPFRRRHAERREGTWQGARFLFNERKHLFTCEWTGNDNGSAKDFTVHNAPKDALIDYIVETEGANKLIKCMVIGRYYFWPIEDILKLWDPAPMGRVRLRRGRRLRLYCHTPKNATPTIVRIYAMAWDIQPTILLEYSDRRTDARMVMRSADYESPDEENHATL